MSELQQKQPRLTVYYDDKCPLCTKEINFYRKRIDPKQARWVAISETTPKEIDRNEALKSLHVFDCKGRKFIGVDAFIEIWARVPNLNVIARILKFHFFKIILKGFYGIFLILRKSTWRRG